MKRKSYTDALTTLAKGTDAGLYRLIPERVEIVNSEEEVQEILAECRVIGKPLTFKAGGTSLSGQTITDSVLVEIGPDFGKIKISEDGRSATFPCGITGDHANRLLKRYGRKLVSVGSWPTMPVVQVMVLPIIPIIRSAVCV